MTWYQFSRNGQTYLIPQAGTGAASRTLQRLDAEPACVTQHISGLLAALLGGAEANGSLARTANVPPSAPASSAVNARATSFLSPCESPGAGICDAYSKHPPRSQPPAPGLGKGGI